MIKICFELITGLLKNPFYLTIFLIGVCGLILSIIKKIKKNKIDF